MCISGVLAPFFANEKEEEDRNIFDMMIQKKSGEIALKLSDEQYAKLKQPYPVVM
jgi:hypothetical protein